MPFVYSAAELLQGKPKIGNGQCAVLVQHYVKVGLTKTWKAGMLSDGTYPYAPNNAEAFYIIEKE